MPIMPAFSMGMIFLVNKGTECLNVFILEEGSRTYKVSFGSQSDRVPNDHELSFLIDHKPLDNSDQSTLINLSFSFSFEDSFGFKFQQTIFSENGRLRISLPKPIDT